MTFDIRITGLNRERNYGVNYHADGDTLVFSAHRHPTEEQAKRQEHYRRDFEVAEEGNSSDFQDLALDAIHT